MNWPTKPAKILQHAAQEKPYSLLEASTPNQCIFTYVDTWANEIDRRDVVATGLQPNVYCREAAHAGWDVTSEWQHAFSVNYP